MKSMPRNYSYPCDNRRTSQGSSPNIAPASTQCGCQHASLPNCEAMTQSQLMKHINEVSFAAYDILLYLDTHPCDTEALAYSHEMITARRNALAVYSRKFGPLTLDETNQCSNDYWKWIMQPWPWEPMQKGGCK